MGKCVRCDRLTDRVVDIDGVALHACSVVCQVLWAQARAEQEGTKP